MKWWKKITDKNLCIINDETFRVDGKGKSLISFIQDELDNNRKLSKGAVEIFSFSLDWNNISSMFDAGDDIIDETNTFKNKYFKRGSLIYTLKSDIGIPTIYLSKRKRFEVENIYIPCLIYIFTTYQKVSINKEILSAITDQIISISTNHVMNIIRHSDLDFTKGMVLEEKERDNWSLERHLSIQTILDWKSAMSPRYSQNEGTKSGKAGISKILALSEYDIKDLEDEIIDVIWSKVFFIQKSRRNRISLKSGANKMILKLNNSKINQANINNKEIGDILGWIKDYSKKELDNYTVNDTTEYFNTVNESLNSLLAKYKKSKKNITVGVYKKSIDIILNSNSDLVNCCLYHPFMTKVFNSMPIPDSELHRVNRSHNMLAALGILSLIKFKGKKSSLKKLINRITYNQTIKKIRLVEFDSIKALNMVDGEFLNAIYGTECIKDIESSKKRLDKSINTINSIKKEMIASLIKSYGLDDLVLIG